MKGAMIMPDWAVNLIIGLSGTILGFIGGFFTKSIVVKNRQSIKGDNNSQRIGDINNGKE